VTPSLILAALLTADAPTIVVEIDALALPHAQTEQLHGELMTRLVEFGHPVGSAGAITVRLTGGGQRVHVEVQHGSRSWTRDVEGSGALLRLATIHAALDLLGQVDAVADPDPARASAPERSVLVEADDDAAAWVPEVIAALVDAGNVVKPSSDGARWRVCLDAHEGRPMLAVASIDAACAEGVPTAALARDLAAALAAARETVPPTAAPPATVDDEPVATTPPVTTTDRAAPVRATPWSGAVGLDVGAQARLRAAEALIVVHGDARHASGAMMTLRVELAPSVASSLGVVDSFVAAGAGYAFTPRPRVRLEVVATAGAVIHGYGLADDRDARVDFTAALPLVLAISLASRIELGITALAGVSTRPRRHLVGDDVVWSRSRWRVAGLVGLRFVLGRKLAAAKMAGGA
jgi:hypothetical protein